MVLWLRLRASTAGGTSSVPAQGAKTEKKKKKKNDGVGEYMTCQLSAESAIDCPLAPVQ